MTDLIPRTNDEFAREYSGYVAKLVSRLNNRPENFADLLQSIWLKLLESDIVGKFHERAHESRPEALTTEEVCLHLGITTDSWVDLQARHQLGCSGLGWMPCPIAGDATSLDALWSTDEVERYEPHAHQHHEMVGESERLIPRATSAQFRTYVQRAVHNAYANWCRTNNRRNKDRLIDAFPDQMYRRDEGEAFSLDDLFDAVQDTERPAARMEASIDVRSVMERLGPQAGTFFDLLSEGYTLREAAKRLKYDRFETQRLVLRLGVA